MKLIVLLLLPLLALSQSKNNTDIFDAVRQGNLNQVKQYIEVDRKVVDTLNSHNHSLLIIAAYYNQQSIVEHILPYVTNLNHNSDNGTALAAAVVKNNVEIIKVLLNHKADVNLTDANGVSPLMYAIMFKNIQVIKLLIEHGADLKLTDKTGKSTFEYAISSDNQEIINLLKN
ncbi:ankyrin repeat domain-containing protein [Algibacter pacificus]|uniref:ankyrin repeat domain-containing protein n=1 Tax=Algibacter pacificus TaxID=2599389 RepID=UPI0011C72DF0|nr:ankyrin repeat domain-containing protein [Algibacter pacificus]